MTFKIAATFLSIFWLSACSDSSMQGATSTLPTADHNREARTSSATMGDEVPCAGRTTTGETNVVEGDLQLMNVEEMSDGWVISWFELDQMKVIDSLGDVKPFRFGVPGGVDRSGLTHMVTHHPLFQGGEHVLVATVDRGDDRRAIYDASSSLFLRRAESGAFVGQRWADLSEALADAPDRDGIQSNGIENPGAGSGFSAPATLDWSELVSRVTERCRLARQSMLNSTTVGDET